MANNIVALNLNGTQYDFRPLCEINDTHIVLSDFDMVDGAAFLVYISEMSVSGEDNSPITIEVNDGEYIGAVQYHGRSLYQSDLSEGQVYEFIFCDGTFHLTTDIPKTSIKYRDNRNQLQTLVIGENPDIDLSAGVYYATTSSTATRVSNSLILTDVNGDMQEYNGAQGIDLSAGVNYATTAGSAPQDHYKNSVSATAGASSSGSQISIPHITTNGYGHVTNLGTRTHNVSVQKISKFCTVAGGQNKDKYFYIGSILCDSAWSGYHANLSFVGAEAAWSGILYFGFRISSTTTQFSGAELKWLSLTRSDMSDKIIMTYTDETEGRRVHLYFKYPENYLTTSISIISEGETSSQPFIFNGAISSTITGTLYKTSTFDGGSAGNLNYRIFNDSGSVTHGGLVDLGNEPFDFRSGQNINISPSSVLDSNTNGIVIKLSEEFTQAFDQLQQTVAKQQQQITDLKSVLTEITTGKTWDSSIWS